MDSSENSSRVRKPYSLLQDERNTVFVNGYAVPVPAATRPPLPPPKKKQKTSTVAIAVVPDEPLPPADLPQPDGTGTAVGAKEVVPPKRVQIQWTDEVCNLFMEKIVEKNAQEHGHMKERFEVIATELYKLDLFKNFTVVKGDSFQSRFLTMKKEAKTKWALDCEGANLSGLAEFNSDAQKPWEKILYTLIVRELKGEKGKAIRR